MRPASAGTTSETTLEREWGRLRRGQLVQLLRASSEPGCSPLGSELLRAIAEAGEMRASDLANVLLVTRTSISRYVNEMLEEGLLSQRRDPVDGRAALLSLSAKGRTALEEREARRSAVLREFCHDWPEGDVDTLTRLLRRLNDAIQERLIGQSVR